MTTATVPAVRLKAQDRSAPAMSKSPVVRLIILFFSLQRYWRSGLAAGAVKG